MSERYGDRVFTQDQSNEKVRLQSICDAYDQVSFRQIEALGLPAQAVCLDVGAGPGTVAAFLSQRWHTIAADKDTRLLEQLTEYDGLDVVATDITAADTLSGLGPFDLVHSRFVLMHLRDRKSVLTSLAECLRADSNIVISDFIDLTPDPTTAVGQVMAAMWQVLGATIGTDIPQPLWVADWLKRNGFGRVTTEVYLPSAHGGAPVSTFWRLTWEQLRERLTMLVDADTLEQAMTDLSSSDFSAISPGMITTTGVKL